MGGDAGEGIAAARTCPASLRPGADASASASPPWRPGRDSSSPERRASARPAASDWWRAPSARRRGTSQNK